jgi:adenylate kinase family enzyme
MARLAARGRPDDLHRTIRRRLLSHYRHAHSLHAWFASRGILEYVDGNRHPTMVTASLQAKLGPVFDR